MPAYPSLLPVFLVVRDSNLHRKATYWSLGFLPFPNPFKLSEPKVVLHLSVRTGWLATNKSPLGPPAEA